MPAGNTGLAIRLVLAMTRLQRCLLSQRAAGEPTISEDSALSWLYRNGPMTIGQLATHENVQPPTMTRVVASLEAHRLVTRGQEGSDRRRVTLDLTPLGRERVGTGAPLRAQWLEAHLDVLTEHERSVLSEAADILNTIAVKDPSSTRAHRLEGRQCAWDAD
jgi:DNA-binding MarR family transcriptional regulator